MPIIKPIEDPTVSLGQGDILDGISLFSTKETMTDGGTWKKAKTQACLVISRPCIAVRAPLVTVAAIDTYKVKPGSFEGFNECWEFYKDVRDGLSTPDQLYIGQIPGREGAFCARFDLLHTIAVPESEVDRLAFLKQKRIGRLHPDFRHDLHQRLTRAFASLGFDDHDWFPQKDLETLLSFATIEEGKKQAAVAAAQAQVNLGASGFTDQGQQTAGTRDLAAATKELEKFQAQIKPFKDALDGRKASQNL